MDFLNKEKLTHIIIFIFILLSLTYLYNMNSNISNPIKTKIINEKFMTLTEDQYLESNKVLINNLTQVEFTAGGNNNGTINFPNPDMAWPVSLQDIFDTKLDNSGVVGGQVPSGHTPLQGIVLSDKVGKTLVKIGDNISFGPPITATTINDNCIQFGGPNNDRQANSASIFASTGANDFPTNTLCIVGMTTGKVWETGKISMHASGGLKVFGPTTINGTGTITGTLDVTGTISSSASIFSTGGLTMTGSSAANNGIGGAITIKNIDKTSKTEANFWNIYNMKTSSAIGGTGKPGSGLTFWRYSKEGCGLGGLCNEHMTLNDDGSSFFKGDLNVNNKVSLGLKCTEPNEMTCISDKGIQFGSDNANREVNSAQITAGLHQANSLNIVGMSQPDKTSRRIDIWAEAGLFLRNNTPLTTDPNSAISFLPKGSIIMFSGGVPGGWLLCDGNNGTPNLVNRFVLGGSWASKDYGGVAEVTLTEAQMPNHTHSGYEFLAANAGYRWYPWGGAAGGLHGGGAWNMSSAQPFEAKGGNQPHTNMPPYCVLIYIMKAY